MSSLLQIVLVLICGGSLVGLLSGMFGMGGAFIIVPLLNIVFTQTGISPDLVQHLAVGTAPSTMLITSLTTFIAHTRMGSMRWDVWKTMLPGIIAGAVSGALLAHHINGRMLETLFGIMVILMSLQLFIGRTPRPDARMKKLYVPVSLFVGMIASMTGVAGSMQLLIFLSWAGHDWCDSVSTSAALTLPISLTATVSYMVLGWNQPGLPTGALGYVYLPGTLSLMIPGIVMAVVGARLAHWSGLPLTSLKRGFSLFGLFIGCSILYRTVLS